MSNIYEEIKRKESTNQYILLSAMYPESDDELKRWNFSKDWDCKERYRFEYKTINKKHSNIINVFANFPTATIKTSENGKYIEMSVNDFLDNYDENNFYEVQ